MDPHALMDALAKPPAGADLTAAEATALLAPPAGTEPVLGAPALRRDRAFGQTLTYSPKVFLPVTNLCRDRCSYCTFRKDPRDPDAWTMTPEEIQLWVARGQAQGCKEALMCLGDKPEKAYGQYRKTLAGFGHKTTTEYVYRAC